MTVLNLLLLALEAVLASVVLPLLTGLLARAFPRSAARRRMVWATMFLILLAAPLAALLPSLTVITLPAPPVAAAPAAPAGVAAAASTPSLGASNAIALALFVWGLGALWLAARGLAGLVWLERLRFCSAPLSVEHLPVTVPARCSVRLSPDCMGPMTWGALRPVILLPEDASEWPRERLEAALRHELAHVVRCDSLIQGLALAACALYWLNPLVWLAARCLRREAEAAADDAVIAAGMRPSDYASLLVDLAADWPSQRRPSFEMAMASRPILTERVQSILSPNATRSGASAMDTLKFALLGGAAFAALALVRPSIAEEAPASPPALRPAPAPARAASALSTPLGEDRPIILAQAQPRPAKRPDIEASALLPAPAPPAPPAAPAPPAPAAPGANTAVPDVRILVDPPFDGRFRARGKDVVTLTPEKRAELERDLAKIGPTIDKAIADAHIADIVQKELSASDAKTREMVARQLADIGPRIQRAIANAHIQELVAARVAEIQPEIDAAMARARQQGLERSAEASERTASRLEEEAKRARERAQRTREQLKQSQSPPAPQAAPKN